MWPLNHIFNKSAATGIIPEDWKFANVTSIHKKVTDRNLETTDQLVSLLQFAKQNIVKWKIITHLEGNNLIGDSQHSFRNKGRYLTSLLDFFACVIDTHDVGNNKAVDLIYLDFQKAFDKVPHERLLLKVVAHDIQGSATQWIRNGLAGQRQCVCINQTFSSWIPETSGAPQRSVLGPLLFLFNINYLES